MSKRLIVVLALALVVGLTFTAYAEVQNVKVSGDINLLGIARSNFDINNPAAGTPKEDDNSRLFGTQTRIRIDADLTDNVMATVRLINERSWTTETVASTDIDLDLAYVTLKEFLYSPLTLTLGRQEIKFGNGLIIGKSYNSGGVFNGIPSDLSERKAFDALRATLNYDPLVVDFIYSKITNANVNTSDDTNLMGVNASYDINKKLGVQAYLFNQTSKTAALNNSKKNSVYTLGALVNFTPIDNLKTSLEGAWQFGRNRAGQNTENRKEYQGFALQAMADYVFAKVKFTPSIGAAYTYLSGDGKHLGWNSMYYDQKLGDIAYAILPFTNMQVLNLKGSIKPMDDVTIAAKYGNYSIVNRGSPLPASGFVDGNGAAYAAVVTKNKKNLGNEIDASVLYDYTEDVQLGLTAGWFIPGDAIADSRDATQLIASMKVTF